MRRVYLNRGTKDIVQIVRENDETPEFSTLSVDTIIANLTDVNEGVCCYDTSSITIFVGRSV